MHHTAEQIQEKFEQLPTEVKEAIASSEVNQKIRAIGEKHSLHIDQIGELVDETGLVMLGLEKSTDFIDHISNRCSIDKKSAQEIAQEINTEVFGSIRKHLQEGGDIFKTNEEPLVSRLQHASKISAVEQAGGFKIEHHDLVPPVIPTPGITNYTPSNINLINKEHREHKTAPAPANIPSTPESDTNMPHFMKVEIPAEIEVPREPAKMEENKDIDPIADRLMANPVTSKQENFTSAPIAPKNDPYRELAE